MKFIEKHIRAFLACVLILTSCAEIDQPLRNLDRVVKIETKWLSDADGARRLKIYNKEYDKSGHLIKVTEYDSTGAVKIIRKLNYSSAENSEKTEYYNSIGTLDSLKCSYSMKDTTGKVYRSVETNAKGDTVAVLTYKYDSNGNLLNTIVTNLKGARLTETNYSYNGAGSLSSTSITNCITGTTHKIDSLVYQTNNKAFNDIVFDATGNMQFITTFTYDKSGLLTGEMQCNTSGKVIQTFIYDYIFY